MADELPAEPTAAFRTAALQQDDLPEDTRRRDDVRRDAPDLAGTVLDARYRLDHVVRHRGSVVLWHGSDEVLARAVAVRVLVDGEGGSQESERLLSAARSAGRLVHVGAASTYDATTTSVNGSALTYVVSEWVEGRSLGAMLEDGPLPPGQALWIAHATAVALAAAHERRVAHGDLHPGDVVITPHHQVKVLDLEVRAALEPGEGRFEDRFEGRARDDVQRVAALLYAGLTARWPGPGQRGLAPAPEDASGRPCTTRQLRAGVPRDLDALVMGVLTAGSGTAGHAPTGPAPTGPASAAAPTGQAPTGPAPTMRELADRLERSPYLATPEPDLDATGVIDPVRNGQSSPPPGAPKRRRRRRPPVWAAVAGVLVLVVAALLAGLAIGRLPGPTQGFPSAGGGKQSAAPLGPPLVIAAIRSFDPEGDGTEQPASVPLAHDGDPATAWSTDTYATAGFGQLKSGVGLLVDLGSPQTVRQVRLLVPTAGGGIQLRAGDQDGASIDSFPVVATADPAETDMRLTPSDSSPHRWWVVWLTRLPSTPQGFRGEVSEVAFLP